MKKVFGWPVCTMLMVLSICSCVQFDLSLKYKTDKEKPVVEKKVTVYVNTHNSTERESTWTLGSTRDEVHAIEGAPRAIDYSTESEPGRNDATDNWYYFKGHEYPGFDDTNPYDTQLDVIYFSSTSGKVSSYCNHTGTLHVR